MGKIAGGYPVLTAPTQTLELIGSDPSNHSEDASGTTEVIPISVLFPGVIWPTNDVTGAADAAAINAAVSALPASGGTITLLAIGTWYINAGLISINRSGVFLEFRRGAYVVGLGTGDLIRMYDSSTYVGRTVNGGGILGSPVFNISGMGAGSRAFHAGDILNLQVYIEVLYSGSNLNMPGVSLDSVEYWTERVQGVIRVTGCNCTIDNSANLSGQATGSFERSDPLIIYCTSGGLADGVIINNGAASLGYKLAIYGNFLTSTTQFAVLRILGSNSGGASGLGQGNLVISVELDDNAHLAPYTIYIASGCYITGAYGSMQFAGAFTPCNNPAVLFSGPILGDSVLASYASLGSNALAETITANGQTIYTTFYSTVYATGGSTSYTGQVLQAGDFNGQPVSVVNTGTGALTFAAAGTSNVANGASAVIAGNTFMTFIWDSVTSLWYTTAVSSGGGSGTVTSASVVSANGFAGTVATSTTTPAITLSTSVTGMVKGNGTALSAAAAGTDYVAPTGSGAALTGITVGQVSGGAPLASPTFTGTPAVPTATAGTNTTQAGSTAFVTAAVTVETSRATTAEGLLAPKASPTFTGTPAAPTATAGTNTTQVATTAFVLASNVATATNLVGGATLPDYLAPHVASLTASGGTVAVNAALGNAFNYTVAAATTISNPTSPVDGQVIRFRITSGGSFVTSWGTAYDFGTGTAPTLSVTSAKVDICAFEYVASISKWCFLGAGLGY